MSNLLFCNLLWEDFIECNSWKLNLSENVTSLKFSALLSSYAFPYISLYKSIKKNPEINMLCNLHTPKTRLKTVYHQSITEAFWTLLRFFIL